MKMSLNYLIIHENSDSKWDNYTSKNITQKKKRYLINLDMCN